MSPVSSAITPQMTPGDSIADSCPGDIGHDMYRLIERLYPVNRSITGDGVRQTLAIVQQIIPLDITEVPTGTQVFDWTVPKEWNVRDAYIQDSSGRRIIDFNASNLHVVSYSTPLHRTMRLDELKPHLFSIPERPDWIPNRTSYYHEDWGFCVTHHQLLSLTDDEYEVCVDSRLEPGSLTYGEYLIAGASQYEVLIYTHTCHPSLCNDNLSGIALAAYLARALASRRLRYSYRFIFGPGAIGSICWLARNEARLERIKHGLVAVLIGDAGKLTYKQSRRGDAEIDRVVRYVLEQSGKPFAIEPFTPFGYDERQFCSPGINLPVGRLTRTPSGAYPEYHTSADDLDLVKPDALADSYQTYAEIFEVLERNRRYLNTSPKCEPQLGKRGVYSKSGGHVKTPQAQRALLWMLNLSDGEHSLLDIAGRSGLGIKVLDQAAQTLMDCQLLEPLEN